MFNFIPLDTYIAKRNLRAHSLPSVHPAPVDLPKIVSLVSRCPLVYDQGDLGSCTANALALAIIIMEATNNFRPSRQFIYYNERALENSIAEDAGADEWDGLLYVSKNGVCSEATWPYNVKQFAVKPPQAAFDEAKKHICTGITNIPKDANFLTHIKMALAAGYPVTCGFVVYSSFESAAVAKTGLVPMPKNNEKCLGGHEVCIVGYDDSKQQLIIQNSWGADWGDHGRCYFSYDFVNKYLDQATYFTGFNNQA